MAAVTKPQVPVVDVDSILRDILKRNIKPLEKEFCIKHVDARGIVHSIFLNKNALVAAGTRAGKTLLAAKIAREAVNNGYTVINFTKNLTAQASDWELKHKMYNNNNEWMYLDDDGTEHIFITDLGTKSPYFLSAFEFAKKSNRVYHILKNESNLAKLDALLEEVNLNNRGGKRILFLVDEVHHVLHETNRGKSVKSNIRILEFFARWKEWSSVIGFTATPNSVRHHPLWEGRLHYLWPAYSIDMEEEATFFPIPPEKHREFKDGILPSEAIDYLDIEVSKPGVLLVQGQKGLAFQHAITNFCNERYKDNVSILEVNESEYRLYNNQGGSKLTDDYEGNKIQSMIAAVDFVYRGNPEKKIIVVVGQMGEEGESYHDYHTLTCLTGLLWCPPLHGVDDTSAQVCGRLDFMVAKDLGYEITVCSFQPYWRAICEYIRKTAETNEKQSLGLDYSTEIIRSAYFASAVVNKKAYAVEAYTGQIEDWNKVHHITVQGIGRDLRNAPDKKARYKIMADARNKVIKPQLIESHPDLAKELMKESAISQYPDLEGHTKGIWERYLGHSKRTANFKNRRLVTKLIDDDTVAASVLLYPIDTVWNPKKYRVYDCNKEVVPYYHKTTNLRNST